MSVYKPAGYEKCIIKITVGSRERKFPGVKDKSVSRSLERQIKRLAGIRSTHDAMPAELAQWVQELPQQLPDLYDKLIEHGLLSRSSTDGRRSLNDLLYGVISPTVQFEKNVEKYHRNGNNAEDAQRKAMALHPQLYHSDFIGWFQYLLSKNNNPDYVLLRTGRVRAVLEGCGFKLYEDLDANRLNVWLQQQREGREDFGAATSNHHVNAMKSFTKWLMSVLKRFHEPNPFATLEALNTEVDVRRQRRAPNDAEIEKLLKATRKGKTHHGLAAEDREILYRFALTMGVRAAECASLIPENFRLKDVPCTLTIQAGYSKHRRQDVLPVPVDLAMKLKPWLAKRKLGQPLWPGSWANDAAAMLRDDLDAAGIPYKTTDGYFDFHAQRHGAITRGSHCMRLPQLKAFARHGKIEMTMRYTHTGMDDLASAVALLPPLSKPSKKRSQKSGGQNITSGPNPISSVQKSDQSPDQTVAVGNYSHSSVVTRNARPETTQPSDFSEGCTSADSSGHKRGRRGSNPQPPDRQSGTLTN